MISSEIFKKLLENYKYEIIDFYFYNLIFLGSLASAIIAGKYYPIEIEKNGKYDILVELDDRTLDFEITRIISSSNREKLIDYINKKKRAAEEIKATPVLVVLVEEGNKDLFEIKKVLDDSKLSYIIAKFKIEKDYDIFIDFETYTEDLIIKDIFEFIKNIHKRVTKTPPDTLRALLLKLPFIQDFESKPDYEILTLVSIFNHLYYVIKSFRDINIERYLYSDLPKEFVGILKEHLINNLRNLDLERKDIENYIELFIENSKIRERIERIFKYRLYYRIRDFCRDLKKLSENKIKKCLEKLIEVKECYEKDDNKNKRKYKECLKRILGI